MKKTERKDFLNFLQVKFPGPNKVRMGVLSHSVKRQLLQEFRKRKANSDLPF